MACDTCNFYFSFWAIFCPFTPITAQKIKILQNWKKTLEISSFYTCVPKIMSRWSTVPEVWCVTDGRTDGWTDAQKKWHIEVGAPHKNLNSKKASDIFVLVNFLKCSGGKFINQPLTFLFNESIRNGIVPEKLKLAVAYPIHKKRF